MDSNQEQQEAGEMKYASSEEHTNSFQSSLSDFWQKFEEEEETRATGERKRQQEFSHTLTEFTETFDKNHRRRQELHEKADAAHEKRFQEAEAGRRAMLNQEQRDRLYAFEIEHKAWSQLSESYSARRRELLAESRKSCIDQFTDLEVALVAQFHRFLENHFDEFLKDNLRRDDFIKEKVGLGDHFIIYILRSIPVRKGREASASLCAFMFDNTSLPPTLAAPKDAVIG